MAKLKDSERARLPDSAFAYVDSQGRRRLPIHDEAHVRNALARFEQVAFEDEGSRERARRRLLNAAKRYGIVPVGFIDGQLKSVRARSGDVSKLPTGMVTFLLTDIEGSTGLLRRLGDRYAGLLTDVRTLVRQAVRRAGGHEVDARADEFFAAFEDVAAAIAAAVDVQLACASWTWPDGVECRLRVGLHSGEPTLTESGYIGLSVHTAARVCSVAHGGQIVATGETKAAARGSLPAGTRLRGMGRYLLPGLTSPVALFQVESQGLASGFPPPRETVASPAGAR
jgi:class 3 adenylate cyclase